MINAHQISGIRSAKKRFTIARRITEARNVCYCNVDKELVCLAAIKRCFTIVDRPMQMFIVWFETGMKGLLLRWEERFMIRVSLLVLDVNDY